MNSSLLGLRRETLSPTVAFLCCPSLILLSLLNGAEDDFPEVHTFQENLVPGLRTSHPVSLDARKLSRPLYLSLAPCLPAFSERLEQYCVLI